MSKAWDLDYKNKWDNRYKEDGYVYGEEPNAFFKTSIKSFKPKHILMPAEGEGRNAVFAAQLGWQVTAFDLSIQGQLKAKQLADLHQVHIDYKVVDLDHLNLQPIYYDAIGLIYAHFSSSKKVEFHHKLNLSLKSGGYIIFEAFSKNHLKYNTVNSKVGGPKDIDMLYSIDDIKSDFKDFDILYLKEEVVELSEGKYHRGQGSVIRFIGQKM